jgi:hypothetical protein
MEETGTTIHNGMVRRNMHGVKNCEFAKLSRFSTTPFRHTGFIKCVQ